MTYADPQTAVALLGPKGAGQGNLGNLAVNPAGPAGRLSQRAIRLHGQTTPREAALVVHRLPTGQWLVSGRIAGEGLRSARRSSDRC